MRNKERHVREEIVIGRRRDNFIPPKGPKLGETLVVRDSLTGIMHRTDDAEIEVKHGDDTTSADLITDLKAFLKSEKPDEDWRGLTQRVLDEHPEAACVKIFVKGTMVAVQNRLKEPPAEE